MKLGNSFAKRISMLIVAAGMLGLLGGCASTSGVVNPKDHFEGFNRAMFGFNEGLDAVIIKPVATGYDYVLPSPIKTGVTNFFGNIADIMIGVNNLLQGKVPDAFSDGGRFLINTTIGIAGLFDVATEIGLPKHEEDFGQTFGWWGLESGDYLVWPFLGPRTVRDSLGLVLDLATDPVLYHRPIATRNAAIALRIVSDRANLLPADKVIEEAALDKYSYVRDAYLQRRRSLVHDGNAPREAEEE